MKLFSITHRGNDTCGNSWEMDSKPRYVRGRDIWQVWEAIGCLVNDISEYTTRDGDTVFHSRTPKGKGYGQWEKNPDFDPKHSDVVALSCGGFMTTDVWELGVESVRQISSAYEDGRPIKKAGRS